MSLATDARQPDWEAFYRDYKKPGYVPGFEITSKLGGGMFGLVFRARRMSIGKDYAIKFLQVDDGEVRKAVLSELEQVQWFAQIDHPNLVSIEDRGEVDGIPYLVMAFAGTETLRDKLDGTVPVGEVKDELLRWFLQACRGLAALHERSLVHFDVKPANVFLKGAVARLGDYGLSKLITHSRGSLSMGRGTPYYMAPEMLQRRGDHRSDVYSLGVMLYEVLTGVVPFTGDSEWEVLKKHETAAPAMPAHLDAREVAILQRCLHKDPAARFQSVHDLIAAFAAPVPVARGRAAAPVELAGCLPPPLPRSAPAPARSGTAPPPRGRRVSVVAVAMVFVAAGIVLSALRASRDRATFAAATPAPAAPARDAVAARSASSIGQKVDQLVQKQLTSVRTAVQRQRRTSLRDVDPDDYALPRDFRAYQGQLRELGRAPFWSGAKATQLERLGRAGFVAGIVLLHDVDYDDADDCARAVNVLRWLGQVTGIEGLAPTSIAAEPGEGDVCRLLALADGWRRLAEQFARTDAAFQQLLAAKGKAGWGQK